MENSFVSSWIFDYVDLANPLYLRIRLEIVHSYVQSFLTTISITILLYFLTNVSSTKCNRLTERNGL